MLQTTDTLLLVRPSGFGFNEETAASNNFQHASHFSEIATKARIEFAGVEQLLSRENIGLIVPDDVASDKTPDAIFPNNWVSFHEQGQVVIYPMEAPNRRRERRMEIVERVNDYTGIKNSLLVDLTEHEKKGHYLEGTGSIVFDHLNKTGYVALSSRSHPAPLKELANALGYNFQTFTTRDYTGKAIYHTNVLLSIGTGFAVICDSCIQLESARYKILADLEKSERKLITIDGNQMSAFAGNMLEIKNLKGDPYLLLSETALNILTTQQRKTLESFGSLLPVTVPVIEKVGGGSIRCMVAEVFIPKNRSNINVTIKVAENAPELEASYDLRWRVLRAPWNQLRGSERDDQELLSTQFIAVTDNNKIIGTARLQEMAPGTAQVRYMAVDPATHGKGIGKKLLEAMEKEAMKSGYHYVFLQARENAVPFYKANGYSIIEKTFLLYEEIQHYSMRKSLK